MVYLLSFFLILLSPKLDKEPIEMRTQYYQAVNNEEIANQLDKELSAIKNKTPLEKGYLGANKMVLAKYALWPNTKFSLFSEGKTLLEEAIKIDPKNLELLFLRYPIQLKAPSFLGYNQNIESDRKTLISQVKSISDKDLKNKITRFLIKEGNLSELERKSIQ